MYNRTVRLAVLVVLICVAGLIGWTLLSAPRHPIALLQVIDGERKPIAGAIIGPEGLRTKPGPYASGWYSWRGNYENGGGVSNAPVKTDGQGYARLPYPKYVFEKIDSASSIHVSSLRQSMADLVRSSVRSGSVCIPLRPTVLLSGSNHGIRRRLHIINQQAPLFFASAM